MLIDCIHPSHLQCGVFCNGYKPTGTDFPSVFKNPDLDPNSTQFPDDVINFYNWVIGLTPEEIKKMEGYIVDVDPVVLRKGERKGK
ncbi:hypothetical protein GYA19_04055 [Candidatus Beckwithbacteria bacterium]|nr:hypothetical protein [Candidatus Beckwithbacteria bacterium]